MKLIVDIPNRIYVMTKETKNVIDADNEYVASAIANGTPLDDVKFHIEHMACKQYEHRLMLDRQEVIDILDNIGKAESQKLADNINIGLLNQSLEDVIDCS